MKKNLLFLSLLSISTFAEAQWDSITKFNQVISDIKTYSGKLYIAVILPKTPVAPVTGQHPITAVVLLLKPLLSPVVESINWKYSAQTCIV